MKQFVDTKILKNKDNIQAFVVNYVLMLVFWGSLIRKNFNSDTLGVIFSADADIMHNVEEGRYVKALLDFVLMKMGIRITDHLSIAIIVAFGLYALAMVLLQNCFKKWAPEDKLERVGFYAMISLVFLTPLFVENLMFAECSIHFGLTYFLAQIGVCFWTKRKFFWSLLFIFLGVCTYQNAAIYASVVLVFIIMLDNEAKWSIKAVREELLAVIGCMGMGLLDFLLIRVLDRLGLVLWFMPDTGKIDYLHQTKEVINDFSSFLKNCYGLLPSVYMQLLLLLGAFCVIIITFVQNKEYSKILFCFVATAGSFMLVYVLAFIRDIFYFPGRMSFCLFLVLGLLVASLFVLGNVRFRKLLTIASLGYLLVMCVFAGFIMTSKFMSNRTDKLCAEMLVYKIEEYEAESGIKVTKLAVCNDSYAPNYYEGVGYTAHQVNERTSTQAPRSLVNYTTGRYFEPTEMNEEIYNTYFAGRDWTVPDMSEQLVIVGDTAYWCMY